MKLVKVGSTLLTFLLLVGVSPPQRSNAQVNPPPAHQITPWIGVGLGAFVYKLECGDRCAGAGTDVGGSWSAQAGLTFGARFALALEHSNAYAAVDFGSPGNRLTSNLVTGAYRLSSSRGLRVLGAIGIGNLVSISAKALPDEALLTQTPVGRIGLGYDFAYGRFHIEPGLDLTTTLHAGATGYRATRIGVASRADLW